MGIQVYLAFLWGHILRLQVKCRLKKFPHCPSSLEALTIYKQQRKFHFENASFHGLWQILPFKVDFFFFLNYGVRTQKHHKTNSWLKQTATASRHLKTALWHFELSTTNIQAHPSPPKSISLGHTPQTEDQQRNLNETV